jgi:Kef-type K+ transport system membrane component KefB/voltage-gated potassium channel Kch
MTIFTELSIIVLVTALAACLVRLLRQPLVVGYIIAGILVGPHALNVLHSTSYIELFSKIGISILLFIVGLNLNPLVIRQMGKISLFAGFGQVFITTVLGFYILQSFGFTIASSLIGASALTFSSTIIILKLLSDSGDVDNFYGRISIGILLIQDIMATLVLLIISTLSNSEGSVAFTEVIILLIAKGVVAIFLLYLISRYILPRISHFFAASQELLFLFSLAWGLGLAALFYSLGFSIEIGALIAGVTLSISPFALEIGSRMRPLQDFFIILFFVLLGSQVVLQDIPQLLTPLIVVSLFVLIGKPLIVFWWMNILGYRRRLSFQTGMTLGQISEFSLILGALALSAGYVSRDMASLITLVGIISISGSSYLISYSDSLYRFFEPLIKFISIRDRTYKGLSRRADGNDIIIFGYDRVGIDFVQAAEKLAKKYLVVDFNPESINRLEEKGIPYRYGDAEDVEFLHELNLERAQLIISTIPEFKANMLLVQSYRRHNPTGIIIVLSHGIDHAQQLYLAGASYVVMPHFLGAHYAAQMIARHGLDIAEFERERNLHLAKLSKREA